MRTPVDNHPQIKPDKIGVLIVNLGTPEATDYWSVRRYLSEFLSDKRVIDYPAWLWQPLLQGIILSIRPFRSGAAYRRIWNEEKDESPLKTYTRSITEHVQQYFPLEEIVVEWAMRYGKPSMKAGVERLKNAGCSRILCLALYPQYSATTTASVYDKFFDILKTMTWQPAVRTAPDWHDNPAYIDILAKSVQETLSNTARPDAVLCSFHGVPKRYLTQGDPYHCFCRKTSRLLCEKLGWPENEWHTTFQSRFGPEEWLQPYTDKTIEELAKKGAKHIAILSPAFATDCLETLDEINNELHEIFIEKGGETFTYIPCLNDTPAHIQFLAGFIRNELAGWMDDVKSASTNNIKAVSI